MYVFTICNDPNSAQEIGILFVHLGNVRSGFCFQMAYGRNALKQASASGVYTCYLAFSFPAFCSTKPAGAHSAISLSHLEFIHLFPR